MTSINNTHIKVYWDDTLDNYTNTKEREIKRYFEKKYNATANVVFRAIRNMSSTETGVLQADATDQVLDVNYQRQLSKKYLADNNVTLNWDHFVKLDDNVNSKIASSNELNTRYKKFYIRKLILNNFLSYANTEQVISMDQLDGLSIIQSEPANKAGKTSGIVDALLFLFFGKTTKTTVMEEIFNLYTESDVVTVQGELEIDNEIYLIERKISRRLKRDKLSYNIENELNFWQILSDGNRKDLKGEERRKTDKKITEFIGNYDDFLLTIITTIRNFYSLIESKPTERGRIFTRFIGVEVLSEKSEMAKKMMSDWLKTSKLNQTNSGQLDKQLTEEITKLDGYKLLADSVSVQIQNDDARIVGQHKDIEIATLKKHQSVDEELYMIRENDILAGIDKLNELIRGKESSIESLKKDLNKPEQNFDIDIYNHLRGQQQDCMNVQADARAKKNIAESMVQQLKSGEMCPTCKRPLEGVNHSVEISNQEELVTNFAEKILDATNVLNTLISQLRQHESTKDAWSVYDKALLIIQRNELELENFRNNLKIGTDKLIRYRNNKTFIDENRLLDTEIQKLKMVLQNIKEDRESKLLTLKGYEKDIEMSSLLITKYHDLKKEIIKDETIKKIYDTYIEVFGKNGISKMILGTMIPILNSYLNQMMSEAVPFKLEIRLNDKNEIEFWMVDDDGDVEKRLMAGSGYESTISLLALRCVLSKVCSLPKPNIVVFDEVFGQVSNENMSLLGAFFERMKEYFDNIFIITHNPVMLDWANHIIHVKKIDNLTYISANDTKKK